MKNFLCIILLLAPLHLLGTTQDELATTLKQLVAFETLPANLQANKEALQWVEMQIEGLPLKHQYHEFDGHPCLVITTQETKRPTLWLVAHMDVVSGAKSLFSATRKGEKLYGRGVYDMKMAIACYLLLLKELGASLANYNFGSMLTSDEEVGGMHGTKCLLEAGYSSDVAFLPDGGFLWNFEESAKGVLHVKIAAHGSSAHSSRPWEGKNAIDQLMHVLEKVRLLFEKEKAQAGQFFPTHNVGLIQGGTLINQVPDYAEAKIDIRYPPDISPEALYAKMVEITKQYEGVTLEKIIGGSSHHVDLRLSYFQNFRKLAHDLYGIKVGSVKSHGSSDARFFGAHNIPVLVIAPNGGDIHSDREWVDLADLVRFYEVLKAWVVTTSPKP